VLRSRWVLAAVGAVVVIAAVIWVLTGGARRSHEHHRAQVFAQSASVLHLGTSVLGRPIDAVEVGQVRGARADLLVVGCIHGNEPAGIGVAHQLRKTLAGRRLDAWLVDVLNPDGRARDTRQNAHGVDLNRNFPWHWQPLGPPGTQQYAGPHALSEPEARIAYRLILRIRPRIAIWFHQPLAVVDESGGSVSIERRFSTLAGLRLRRLTRYPGSAVGWENHAVPGSTAFVVELPSGPLSAKRTAQIAAAAAALAAQRA
jgi:protein MpaA